MTVIQFLSLAVLSIVATAPAVLLIPRARQSPMFDRVLWGATWVLAFIGTQIVPSYLGDVLRDNDWVVAQLPVLQTGIGAFAGAFPINLLLWLIDRFDKSSEDEDIRKNDEPNK